METLIVIGIVLVVLYVLFRIFKAFLKWGIILLIVVFAIAFFTNPEESSHQQSLKEQIRELNLKRVREKLIKVEDYKVFSLTKVNVDGEEKVVGIGAFGRVWYFDELKEHLRRKRGG